MKRQQTITLDHPCVEIDAEDGKLRIVFVSGRKKAVIHASHYYANTLARKLGQHLAARVKEAQAVLDGTEKAFHRGVAIGTNGEE